MASSSSSSSMSSTALSPQDPLEMLRRSPALPTNSAQFNFACRCLNVQVDGRVPLDVHERIEGRGERSGQDLPGEGGSQHRHKHGHVRVWLGTQTEHVKHPAYVTYDQDSLGRSGESLHGATRPNADDTLGPSWRICWLCGVKVYLADGRMRSEPAAEEAWVVVRLNHQIRYGADLEAALQSSFLPFSNLLLDLASSSSTFGRPPQGPMQPIYPPISRSHTSTKLIPPVHDPFFLPPPFIPNHPHLRDLCDAAVALLRERHGQLEDEVKAFIVKKAQEMQSLEERVRTEVEMMWVKFESGPGRDDMQRSRSGSMSRSVDAGRARSKERVQAFSPDADIGSSVPRNNPILIAASVNSPYPAGASLLSASLSANAFSPPAPQIPDAVDNAISEMSKTFDKSSDSRAVAMSYVFSNLDEKMSGAVKESRRKKKAHMEGIAKEDLNGKDSWIEGERAIAGSMDKRDLGDRMGDIVEEDVGGRTPRPRTIKDLAKDGKEKLKVTFEEPKQADSPASPTVNGDEDPPDAVDDDEYVFDFELEDGAAEGTEDGQPAVPDRKVDISASRNMIEANLSSTFAAEAPSHRSTWRRIRQSSSIYSEMQRRTSDMSSEEPDEEDPSISKLAVSMPMSIVMPRGKGRSATDLPALERKTSLTDRSGVLVPPLFSAMRERGIAAGNSLGLDVPSKGKAKEASPVRPGRDRGDERQRRGSRSTSVSRDREQVKKFGADPGAVFETLVDDGEDSGEDQEEQVGGTLRDSRTFVPPHVLARKESRDVQDVGWRSMVDG